MSMWYGVILLALGSNLDNLGVGISYGLRGVRVTWAANVAIAAIAFVITLLSVVAGDHLAHLLPLGIARHLGAAILFCVALGVGIQAWLDQAAPPPGQGPRRILRVPLGIPGLWMEVLRDPHQADVDGSGTIDLRESLLLGIALSLNNLGAGVGAGLGHYPAVVTALASALGSWFSLAGGQWLGRRCRWPTLGSGAGYIASVILLVVAFWEW